MKDIYGTGLKEYPSSGHINDVFIITPNRIEIFVENIWTSTKSNFQRDLNILHRFTASVKILIVNPDILKNPALRRDFEKTRISERQRGIALSEMIDGLRILNDPEFVNNRFVEIVEELVNDVQMKTDPILAHAHRKRLLKKALINELSIIRKTLLDGLQSGEPRISDDQFPLIIETYNSIKTELVSFLKPDSLAVIQRTYHEIRKMNLVGGGHIVIPPSSHLYQFTDFDEVIKLIDDSISRLK